MPCGDKREKRVHLKEVVDFHINDSTLTETNKPADFSFHGMTDLTPIGCENARSTRLGEPPEKQAESRKFLTRGLWLNNNKLTNLAGLDKFVANIIDKPELLTLLDLSFNLINKIDDVLTSFKNLSILHLHGNLITSEFELIKLYKLKKLRNVTFHGNPISESQFYRKLILLCCPGIVHLDHCGVLKSERMAPPDPNALEMLRNYSSIDGKRHFTGRPFRIEDLEAELEKHEKEKAGKGDHKEEKGKSIGKKEEKTAVKKEEKTSKKEEKAPKKDDKKLEKKIDKKDENKLDKIGDKKVDIAVDNVPPPIVVDKVIVTPGITSAFIKKRRGACKCCK